MRTKLKEITGKERHTFTATFTRFGWRRGYRGTIRTLLFTDVKMGGTVVCDHIWFTNGKGFERFNLIVNDVIQFNARVASYTKGYKGWRDDIIDRPIERDWKLQYPTDFKKVLPTQEQYEFTLLT